MLTRDLGFDDDEPASRADWSRGVWAAGPEQLTAVPDRGGWVLRGTEPWCSGADRIEQSARAVLASCVAAAVVEIQPSDDWWSS